MSKERGQRNSDGLPYPVLIDIAGNPASPFAFDRLQEMPDDELGALRDLHGTFVRELCSSLTIPLRASVTGEVSTVVQTTFGAYTDSLHTPTAMVFLQTGACEVPCVLEVSPELTSPVLDLLMGGAGKVATDAVRGLTDVEKDLLEKPLAIVARELTRAWGAFAAVAFVPGPIRTNPRIAGPIGRSEPVVAIGIQLTVGEASGSIHIAVPASLAKLVRRKSAVVPNQLRGTTAESEQAIRERLHQQLLIDLDCELRGSSIRLRDLLDLKVGTVVDLGIVCDGAITVCVNGRPKFNGWLTQAGPRMAVTVK